MFARTRFLYERKKSVNSVIIVDERDFEILITMQKAKEFVSLLFDYEADDNDDNNDDDDGDNDDDVEATTVPTSNSTTNS